jgi:hypothetical protein
MALQDIGLMYWPPLQLPGGLLSDALGQFAITFDSATDRLAWVGRSPITDALETIYLRTTTVTTGCTVDVRIETVVNGRPSGTLWGTNTNIAVVIADTDDNVWKTAALTAAASLNAGDEYAIVVVVSSGTPNLQFRGNPGGNTFWAISGHYPLRLQDTGAGTWANIGSALNWIAEFATAGVKHLVGLTPADTGTITAYNSGTAPDERALRFQVPFKCRIAGLRVMMFNIAAGADFSASLWDAAGDTDAEALGQASMDGDFALSTTQDGYVDLLFDAPVTLDIGTTYYAGVRADTANNIGLGQLSHTGVTDAMLAFPAGSAQTYLSTREWTAGAAGAWTDTTTALPLIHLIVDQLDDGVSAGGASAIANLRGNFQ